MAIAAGPYLFVLKNLARSSAYMSQTQAAPDLIPITGFNHKTPNRADIQLIDVINNFEWTHTPAKGRHEVPFCRLSEYKVNFNSLMQNIRYLLSFASKGAGHRLGQDPQGAKNLVGKGIDSFGSGFKKIMQSSVIPNEIKNFPIDPTGKGALTESPYLQPYYGLYGASPSGFDYYFPYFETDWKQVQAAWGEINVGGNLFSRFVQDLFGKEGIGQTFAGSLQSAPTIVGTYIERPKMYQYPDDGPVLNLNFSLINTASTDDVIRNWHLAFMLAYQNLPNKTSKVLLEPPVIYEVEVPGIFYSPFAYIQSLRIRNRGAQRVMTIPYYSAVDNVEELRLDDPDGYDQSQRRWDDFSTDTAARKATSGKRLWSKMVKGVSFEQKGIEGGRPTKIETIIPDAYDVSIQLKSLLPESKNLFYHSILGPSALNRGIYNATIYDPGMRELRSTETMDEILNRGLAAFDEGTGGSQAMQDQVIDDIISGNYTQ